MPLNVRDYGATGVARPAQTLKLENLRHKWLCYAPGITAIIYRLPAEAKHDSIGIQRTIDTAHQAGGGTVIVPAGDYLIAPIELRSRVRLHLEPGATLWGSPELADYQRPGEPSRPAVWQPSHDGLMPTSSLPTRKLLVSAVEAEDVAITGFGRIDAQSPNWVIPWMNARPASWDITRPGFTVFFDRCQRVRVEGIQIHNTPSWTLVFSACDDVQVRGVQIRSFDVINSDGIDLVNTSNARISDCNIWTTDDAICLKNMLPDQTMGNVTVTNCVIRTLCNGLKIGTESVGNFQDITFDNIVIANPDDDAKMAEGGINLCAMDGGFVRNVNISNVVTRNVDCPFYLMGGLRTGRQKAVRTPRPGLMERISISNVQSDGVRYTSWVVGQPAQPIRDVRLANIDVRKTRDFYDRAPSGPVPELPEQYPNPFVFGQHQGRDEVPAFGLYLRHVQNLTASDFRVACTHRDAREFITQEDCENVSLRETHFYEGGGGERKG